MFAILLEVLLIEIQEEIHHFAGWEGGVKGRENREQKCCEQTGISYNYRYRILLPEEFISIAQSDLWECWQKISQIQIPP